MALKLNIKRLHPQAVFPFKKRTDDYCFDCVAVSEEEVAPNVWKYGLGIAIQPANEFDGASIRGISVRSRSSVWKTGMVLSNSVGTIDIEEYTGEISAVFYHVMPSMPRYKVGDKIVQMHIERTENVEFVEVAELRTTDRGNKGYGSSGK